MKQSAALFFSEQDLALARENMHREPVASALALLDTVPDDPLAAAQLQALAYLWRQDAQAGQGALELARVQDLGGSGTVDDLKRQVGWLAVRSMLREHPAWQAAQPLFMQIDGEARASLEPGAGDPLRLAWLAARTMAGAILRQDDEIFQSAAAIYRRLIDEHIHPEGYFKGLVDVDGAEDTYAAQVSATGALALMAEMAAQAGLDLWSYDNRGVSVNTAATYAFYYYFFPERWRWEDGLKRDDTLAVMRAEGAFFEIVNRRSPLRGGEQLFAEQRPMFSPHIGLTTLTHSLPLPRKSRWRIF